MPPAKRPASRRKASAEGGPAPRSSGRRKSVGKSRNPKRTDDLDLGVGQNIRIRRLQAGMSQSDLADALGLSFQQVQKYEKGVNRVGGGRLMRIARTLGCPVVALYDGINDRAELGRPSPLALLADPLALRLATAFVKLRDRAVRRAVVKLAQDAAKAGM